MSVMCSNSHLLAMKDDLKRIEGEISSEYEIKQSINKLVSKLNAFSIY